MINPKQPRVCDVGRVDLNAFAREFGEVFEFPRSPNYLKDVVRCARFEVSMERGYESYGGLPPDSFFMHMDNYGMDQVMEACNQLFKKVHGLCKPGPVKKVYVAIDMHDVLYWGVIDDWVHKKKGVLKNVHVLRYASIAIVRPGFKHTLACRILKKGDGIEDVVRGLLETARRMTKIDVVLVDRGFYSAGTLKTILRMGMDFIIPVRKTKRVRALYHESLRTGGWKRDFTLNRYLETRVDVHLYLKEDEDHEYLGLLSNISIPEKDIEAFFRAYNQRSNIENSYKEKNRYDVKTTTAKKPLRLLFYCIGHMLVNLQQAIRTTYTVFRTMEMKQLIDLLLENKTGRHQLTRKLVVII